MHPKTKAAASGTPPEEWAPGASALCWFAQLNALLGEDHYDDPDKAPILDLVKKLGLRARMSKWVVLRQNRGRLLRRMPGKDPVVFAGGRTGSPGSS